MKELVVISGKGGAGKTSVTASFAALADNAVLADCDVDAADLHLVLTPEIKQRMPFTSGHEARIRQSDCVACGGCLAYCRYDAVRMEGAGAGDAVFTIDPALCEGCGVCVRFCPVQAIDFPECLCGEWYVSETRHGPMVHARLGIAAENSGKLVSLVRREARNIAEARGSALLLVDGPPGIGCPVIASITGADMLLVVTEPSLSGAHDLERTLQLARHFKLPARVCVNKWDINPEMTETIARMALAYDAPVAGKIPYDPTITAAQLAGQSVLEYESGPAAQAITELWENLWQTNLVKAAR